MEANQGSIAPIGNDARGFRKICTVCEYAMLKVLDPRIPYQINQVQFQHHENMRSFNTASDSGCWICTAARTRILEKPEGWSSSRGCGTIFRPFMYEQTSGKLGFCEIRVEDTTASFPSHILLNMYFEQDERGRIERISCRQVSETANLAIASDWINECAHKHDECTAMGTKPLPTRVIDVGTEGVSEPRLLETGNRVEEYTALSHCWGDHSREDQSTTTQNIPERLNLLPFEDLAQTFKDAVTVTRSLGYQYLWIDTFCIVQDDRDDWARECRLMASVYENAVVVLAASCASGPDEGFLHARYSSISSRITADIPSWLSYGDIRIGPYVFGIMLEFPEGQSSKSPVTHTGSNHLSMRAWTWQEENLCTRILDFHHEQLVFRCREGSRYEREPLYHFRTRGIPDMKGSAIWLWPGAVMSLTSRLVTYGDDLLPALAGFAARYQAATGYDFAAGLWRENLLDEMAWTTSQHGLSNAKYESTSWTPSWSWASCPGPVDFPLRSMRPAHGAAADVIDVVSCADNQENPFGTVSRAELKLCAFSRRCKCFWDERNDKRKTLYLLDSEGTPKSLGAHFHLDSNEPAYRFSEDAIDVRILQLLRWPRWISKSSTVALVLRPLDGTWSLFRRIGLLEVNHWGQQFDNDAIKLAHWLEDGEKITIHIV